MRCWGGEMSFLFCRMRRKPLCRQNRMLEAVVVLPVVRAKMWNIKDNRLKKKYKPPLEPTMGNGRSMTM